MRKSTVSVIVGFLTLPLSQAHALTPVPERSDCIEVQGDPYDPGKVMDFGKYQGQCVDTSIKRPAMIVSQNSDEIVFANFRHDGKYWIAHMPRHGVDRLIFQIEDFATPLPFIKAAHTQLRIVMKEGSELVLNPQAQADQATPPTRVHDFDWSLEYAAPLHVSYDIFRGEFDEYALVERLISTRDRAKEQFHDGGNVIQYLLKVPSQDQADAVLVNAIIESDKARLDEIYKTVQQNCTTGVFDLLDESITYATKVDRFQVPVYTPWDPIEGPSVQALQERGLIDDSSYIPTLNVETNNGAKLPD